MKKDSVKARLMLAVCCLGCVQVMGQNAEKYVRVDRNIAQKIVQNIWEQEPASDDPKEILLYKNYMSKALDKYMNHSDVQAVVYDAEVVSKLQEDVANYEPTRVENEKKAMEKKHQEEIAQKDKIIHDRDSVLTERDKTIESLKADSAKLQEKANFAQALQNKYTDQCKALDGCYKSCYNSDLKYVSSEETEKICQDFETFIGLIGQPLDENQQSQLAYLKAVAQCRRLYDEAEKMLQAKYDAQIMRDWKQKHEEAKSSIALLKDLQRTDYQQRAMAMDTYAKVTSYFKGVLIPCLEDKGQIPDQETAERTIKELSGLITLCESNGGKDTFSQKYLNELFGEITERLRNVDTVDEEEEYEKFVSEIKKRL